MENRARDELGTSPADTNDSPGMEVSRGTSPGIACPCTTSLIVWSNNVASCAGLFNFHQLRSTQQVDCRQSDAMSAARVLEMDVTPSPWIDEVTPNEFGSPPAAMR